MYSGILAFGGVNSIGILASVYFLILFISGNCELSVLVVIFTHLHIHCGEPDDFEQTFSSMYSWPLLWTLWNVGASLR